VSIWVSSSPACAVAVITGIGEMTGTGASSEEVESSGNRVRHHRSSSRLMAVGTDDHQAPRD
jgi:hypothetical protein